MTIVVFAVRAVMIWPIRSFALTYTTSALLLFLITGCVYEGGHYFIPSTAVNYWHHSNHSASFDGVTGATNHPEKRWDYYAKRLTFTGSCGAIPPLSSLIAIKASRRRDPPSD